MKVCEDVSQSSSGGVCLRWRALGHLKVQQLRAAVPGGGFFMCEAVQRRAFDASASSNDACRQGPLSSPRDEKGF